MASSRSSLSSSSSYGGSVSRGAPAAALQRRSTASGPLPPPSVTKTSDIAPPTRLLQNARYKLFLRVHSGQNLQGTTQGSYCKLYVGDTIMVSGSQSALFNLNALTEANPRAGANGNGAANPNAPPTHREFRTHVEYPVQRAHPVWNEKFEVGIFDPAKEILSIRVKSQQMVYCPTIGACAIYLKQLKLGETADQWFPLHKGQAGAGHIRLQLLLSVNPLAPRITQQPVARAATNPATLQKQRADEMQRQRCVAEKEAALRRDEEELRQQRKAGNEPLREEEERQRRRKAEKEKARLQEEEEKERRRRRKAEKERERLEEEDNELAKQQKRREKERAKSENLDEEKAFAASALEQSNQDDSNLKEQVVDLIAGIGGVVLANALTGLDSDGGETIEYVSDTNLSVSPSSSRSSSRYQSGKSFKKASSRASSQGSSRKSSTLARSIYDEIDYVEHNALPSDSSDSSSSTSSEEERRRRKKRKEKKKRRKEKKARRKAKKAAKKKKRKSKAADSDSDSSSSSSSSSSPSSSDSSTSSDERQKRKSKKKASKRNSRGSRQSENSRQSTQTSTNQWGDLIDPGMAFDIASAAYSAFTGNNQESGTIDGATYTESNQEGGNYDDAQDGGDGFGALTEIMQGDSGLEMPSVGDWLEATSGAASAAMSASEDGVELTEALVGVASLGVIPIGKYLGKKLHQASSNALQRRSNYQAQQAQQFSYQQEQQEQYEYHGEEYQEEVYQEQQESTYYF